MTRDDIIRMAREAGINVEQGFLLRFAGVEDDLERFATLVAAAERKNLEAQGFDLYRNGYKQGARDERLRADEIIRARGEKP